MTTKTIVCCAITGGADTVGKSPYVPVTPEEIADSAIGAARAGAAIVHLHVRDPKTGQASMSLDLYRETVDRIRASGVDVVINLTTGAGARFIPGAENPREAGPGTSLTTPERRAQHVAALRPEICSLDMGSLNMSDWVFVNTPSHIAAIAQIADAAGARPELEVFEAGHVMLARAMLEDGRLSAPGLFQICLGVRWAQPATVEALRYMQTLLPAGSIWFAFGVGPGQFALIEEMLRLGGHVRVGLEDNLYLERGVLAPSNAALVEKAVGIIRNAGHAIASAAEARAMLSLRPPGS
ncbi:MAG: 3-keto-5-aminohexanoate cleavage protein [Hyphomicrobiaceae bacterium]